MLHGFTTHDLLEGAAIFAAILGLGYYTHMNTVGSTLCAEAHAPRPTTYRWLDDTCFVSASE